MSEFVEKDKVLGDFARYMAGRYRLGYDYLALYWAAVLFEGIIWRKSHMKQGLRPDQYPEGKEPNLYALIQNLSEEALRNDSIWRHSQVFPKFIYPQNGTLCLAAVKSLHDVRKRLGNFRYLRNRIMHELSIHAQDDQLNCDEFICYVWSELAPESFEKALKDWHPEQGGRPVHVLSQISADYMVRAIDETCMREIPPSFTKITATDFDNMFTLRGKLLGLREQLREWLSHHASHLDTDILTTIDTTSAYIWMPLVQQQKKANEDRKGIWDCSVSVLATPLDLRIYLEFGGRARNEREAFYRFLTTSDYAQLRLQQMTGQNWQLFDVDWYSAIFNVSDLDDWQEIANDTAAALAKLPPASQRNPEPITWNRLLHGFIFRKGDLERTGAISFEQITGKLEHVIALHGAFVNYCHGEEQCNA